MTHPHNRLKVVHVGKYYSPHVGGIETHLQALCGALKESMDVKVLVANDEPRDEDAIVDGVSVSRLGVQFSIAGAPVCPTMAWKLRGARADLVHMHLPNPAGILALMVSGYRGRILATWHSDVVRQRRLARLFAPIQRRFLRNCKAIIATSSNYIQSSPDLASFKIRCRVIPYGINLSDFRHADSEAVDAIHRRHPGALVLAVGRLVYYKGLEYLVRAMAGIKATLLIVGDGPLRLSLERQATDLGISDRIRFLGEMQPPKVVPYYHACDVFALPSVARSEAFGIVQLEAMASGKPVVNTSLASGVPYASLDGVTGITVDPGNPQSLESAINRLIWDADLRVRLGKAALHRVQREFSVEAMVSRTRDLYDEVINGTEIIHDHRPRVDAGAVMRQPASR
jgi:glycosyltransferase involved in cell wall biosynthesis